MPEAEADWATAVVSRPVEGETVGEGGQPCPVCGADTEWAGACHGRFVGRAFQLRRCPDCRFVFVADPWLDYERIYDAAYYAGRGVDTRMNIAGESRDPARSIRRCEWLGVEQCVGSLVNLTPESTWLDYGCGAGGLVAFLRARGYSGARGFEPSSAAHELIAPSVDPLTVDQLAELCGHFDVVSAIDVIEHVPDPVTELTRMCSLLRPGGLLFITTGNARPHRDHLARWRYLKPEVHISLFEPATLALALERAGLRPEFPGYGPGWTGIIRYRILKELGRSRTSPVDRLVPWSLLCRLVDRRVGLSAQPVGWNAAAPGA